MNHICKKLSNKFQRGIARMTRASIIKIWANYIPTISYADLLEINDVDVLSKTPNMREYSSGCFRFEHLTI